MKRLLLAYDGSPCADQAIDALLHAGLPARLDVVVLAVADVWLPPGATQPDPNAPPAVRKAQAQAQQAVVLARELAGRAAAKVHALFPGWNVTAEAVGDSPAWAVLKRAEDWAADLVVLGSHGRSMLERLFLGSVSQKVLAEARCSVRISREQPRPHLNAFRQLLAVEGSADSAAAVQAVAARNWPASAQFRVVTVIDPKLETAVAWPDVYASQWVQQRDEEAREWIGRVAGYHAKILADAGLSVETDIFTGDPKRMVLKCAEDWSADAIFLGARGLHHGGRYFLGTTASAITARAHCSVEVVRAR